MGKLEGKVAIVSGSSSGIGFAEAHCMAKEGAKVVMFARGEERLMEKAKIMEAEGFDFLAFPADARKPEDWQMIVEKTIEKYGKLDILVNNAGGDGHNGFNPLATYVAYGMYDRAAWDDALEEHFWTQMNGIQACLPELMKTKGNIINTTSETVIMPDSGACAYIVAKSGILTMSRALANDLGKHGIRVNTICPGYIRTAMIEHILDDPNNPRPTMWKEHSALKTIGEPNDIGHMVAFLASDDAKFITGANFVVDGGYQNL